LLSVLNSHLYVCTLREQTGLCHCHPVRLFRASENGVCRFIRPCNPGILKGAQVRKPVSFSIRIVSHRKRCGTISAGNEPCGRACTSIWRLPRSCREIDSPMHGRRRYMCIVASIKINDKIEKRWLTTTIFSPLHVIM